MDEIPPEFAIRLREGGFTRCYDIRSLKGWFATGSRKNPLTNLGFSAASLDKIEKKFKKVFPATTIPIPEFIYPEDIGIMTKRYSEIVLPIPDDTHPHANDPNYTFFYDRDSLTVIPKNLLILSKFKKYFTQMYGEPEKIEDLFRHPLYHWH